MPVLDRTPYRNLIITGHTGVGKTSIGREVARRLKASFYDVENEIEVHEGYSAETIRELYGEAHLRTLEAQLVSDLAITRSTVITINGLTLLDPSNLEKLKATGPVVCLDAALNEILRRLHIAQGARFHSPDARAVAISRLKRERPVLNLPIPHLDTTNLPVEDVVARTVQFWMDNADV